MCTRSNTTITSAQLRRRICRTRGTTRTPGNSSLTVFNSVAVSNKPQRLCVQGMRATKWVTTATEPHPMHLLTVMLLHHRCTVTDLEPRQLQRCHTPLTSQEFQLQGKHLALQPKLAVFHQLIVLLARLYLLRSICHIAKAL